MQKYLSDAIVFRVLKETFIISKYFYTVEAYTDCLDLPTLPESFSSNDLDKVDSH